MSADFRPPSDPLVLLESAAGTGHYVDFRAPSAAPLWRSLCGGQSVAELAPVGGGRPVCRNCLRARERLLDDLDRRAALEHNARREAATLAANALRARREHGAER